MQGGHYTKLEFPMFNGDGLNDWFHKVEKFFQTDHTLETTKIKLGSIHLEGSL